MDNHLLVVRVVNGRNSHFRNGDILLARDMGSEHFYLIESDSEGQMIRQGSYFKERFRVVYDFKDLCFRYNATILGFAKSLEEL